MVEIGVGRPTVLLDETAAVGGAAPQGGREPEIDIALGPAMLQQVAASGGSDRLRIYRPRPTLAFSGRDCATSGIEAAAVAARAAGFAPVRRGPGGRAAGYHRGALCMDHVAADVVGPQQIHRRFETFGALLVQALRLLGVDAALGQVPGEYCPGEFSVNDGRGHKLIGTAQRLVRGGWLFSTVILVVDADPVRDVLTTVYDALGLAWRPATVGSVQDSVPSASVDLVRAAVLDAYSRLGPLEPAEVSPNLVELAAARAERHRVPGG